MRRGKSAIFILFLSFILITKLSAKETQVAKDVKKALHSYAGMSELKKRGFNLKSLDSAETMEEVYNLLLPYMIQNEIPLDNAIGLYDKKDYKTYDFKQHYTVHFTDDYGTKEQLLKKGYKEEEILAYFSKGKDVYRGGHFSWEKAKSYPEVGQWMMPQFPPIIDKQFIYFLPFYWTEKFYPDYWKTAATKDFIILDLRLDQSGGWQISKFFDYLESDCYKGEVIIIIDSSSNAGEELLTYYMTKWLNGMELPRSINFTTIGENTLGVGNYSGQWKRFENDRNIIWGVRPEPNRWKKCEEGIGLMPDVWAENPEEIFKTVEYITGINNFSKKINLYQDYINLFITFQGQNDTPYFRLPAAFFKLKDEALIEALTEYKSIYEKYINNYVFLKEYNIYPFYIPQSLYQIKDYKNCLDSFSKFMQIQNRWYDFCKSNIEKRAGIKNGLFNKFGQFTNELSAEEYLVQLNKTLDDSIIRSVKSIGDLKDDAYVDFLSTKLEFKSDVKEANRRLESVFLIFNKLEILEKEGFNLHQMDYLNKPEEIINYLQPYFLSKEGYPRDLHTIISIRTNNRQYYSLKQTSRYIVFNDEYGTKAQLKKKGYIEDVTMFYYPYHDGKFWDKDKNWRTGKMIMAMPNNQTYQQTEYALIYYTTEKSVYFKFRNFPHPADHGINKGPEIEDAELEKMIVRLSKETDKENVIFDITKNTGGDGYTCDRISEAVRMAGIKNVYIVIDKGAFSCADHFPLESKDILFKDQNVTLVGYPTMGGTSSGDGETYIINFPDFELTAEIATTYTKSETEHEGWGATPDIYADNLTDALGVIKTLTGDNDIKPFESEERKQYNKGKKRWLENDIIFDIK